MVNVKIDIGRSTIIGTIVAEGIGNADAVFSLTVVTEEGAVIMQGTESVIKNMLSEMRRTFYDTLEEMKKQKKDS